MGAVIPRAAYSQRPISELFFPYRLPARQFLARSAGGACDRNHRSAGVILPAVSGVGQERVAKTLGMRM
jgi:hypothetical protein